MRHFRSALSACALAATLIAGGARAKIPVHALDNGAVRATVSESIGGRLLSFSLAGQPNFLLFDPTAGDPRAPVDAASGNVGFLAHEVWIGPQNQWWTQQDINPARAAAKAPWPPDPYLSLARYTLKHRSASAIELESPASPVNGLQLRKRYALLEAQPNSLRVEATATNRRTKDVNWDLWFNTRVRPETHVYVPVAQAADVRIEPAAALAFTLSDGILSLDMPRAGQPARKGKLFAQPAAGWMAGFHAAQAFIVKFKHQPRAAIHPDQGQVELYHDIDPASPGKGLLEMEVHAPYLRLAPGQTMTASEEWTVLPYAGPATRAAHIAFLRQHAAQIGLTQLR